MTTIPEDIMKAATAMKPLPCPFCGNEPRFTTKHDAAAIKCVTVNCPASPLSSGNDQEDPYAVLARWNTRA